MWLIIYPFFSYPDQVKTTLDVSLKIHIEENSHLHKIFQKIGKFSSEIFIVSNFHTEILKEAKIKDKDDYKNGNHYSLHLSPSSEEKCPRCWKKVETAEENLFCDKDVCGKKPK
jgi:hypothetical protein